MDTVAGGSSLVLPPGLVALLSGLVFPVGLAMIVLSGADLFTSNMMFAAMPFFSLRQADVFGKAGILRWIELVKLLSLSFFGNLAGSLTLAASAAWFGNWSDEARAWTVRLAHKKGTLPGATLFVRGIGANWVGFSSSNLVRMRLIPVTRSCSSSA